MENDERLSEHYSKVLANADNLSNYSPEAREIINKIINSWFNENIAAQTIWFLDQNKIHDVDIVILYSDICESNINYFVAVTQMAIDGKLDIDFLLNSIQLPQLMDAEEIFLQWKQL